MRIDDVAYVLQYEGFGKFIINPSNLTAIALIALFELDSPISPLSIPILCF